MFYSLHCLNLYLFDKAYKEIDFKRFEKFTNTIDYHYLVDRILQAYLEKFKESVYPTLFHEYNILTEAKIVTNGLPEFIEEITNDNEWIEYFLDKYPVFSDLFDKTVTYSILFINELLERLVADYPEVESAFQVQFSELETVEVFSGDNHNNNKSVLKLIFPNSSIYYKPRTLNNEVKVDAFLNYLQEKGLHKSLLIPKMISKTNYGWMEGINYKELENESSANDFYYNQGINLAIFYTLGVSDLIGDNLIAKGTMPCYFDLECILQPNLNDNPHFEIYERSSKASKFIANSVLKTNLLPQYSFVTNEFQGLSNAGLSFIDSQIPAMVTREIDGQFIRVNEVVDFGDSNSHIPSYGNKKLIAVDYINQIIDGFNYAYDFLANHKVGISNYIRQHFIDLQIRVLHRATFIYSKIIHESFLPDYLHDFQKREALFKELEKIKLDYIDNSSIIASEIEQLKNNDIPIFHSKSNLTDILSGNDKIIKQNFFCVSGLDQALTKLNELDETDKQRQTELIKLSFCIHEGYQIKQNSYIGNEINFDRFNSGNVALRQELVADEIYYNYNKIIDSGFNSDQLYSNYSLFQTPSYTWGITSQKWGLFDGLDGLSFFYLNLFRVYNDKKALEIGKQYLEQGLSQFMEFNSYYAKTIGFNKVSLFNYPLSTFYVAEFYLQSGCDITALTKTSYSKLLDWIALYYQDDSDFDLLSGGAGTIIYLLKLYDRVKEEKILDLCQKIAENIIKNGIETASGLYWVSKFGKAHTGLSHGSSGIAFSFLKLNTYRASAMIKQAALKALYYERSMFDQTNQYWNTFKMHETGQIITIENHFWAYGSGGIALSRMLISDYYQDEKIQQELSVAIQNIIDKGWTGNFNYSSGVFGNLDVLNDFIHYKKDSALKSKTNDFVNWLLVEKSEAFDGWSCAPVGKGYKSDLEMIGFFTGISGISNTLLNLTGYEKTVKLFK